MAQLFSSFSLKDITLRNRIAVSPMCQYMASEGLTTDWHHAHYASMARGGPGLVVVEATAVSPEGRISPGCLGLWSNKHAEALKPIAQSIKAAGAVPGIQIAHAGRKASANLPWEGDDHLSPEDPRSWQPLAPSAVAFGANLNRVPKEMTIDDIQKVQKDFVLAAQRARNAGFEWLELHFAHGYLAQSFFSSHSNHRQDEYGGNAKKRGRFLIETLRAVRAVWPESLPLTARFGVIEFDGRDEETLIEAIDLVRNMKNEGLDLLDVSMGFCTPTAQIPWGPGFLVPIAQRVRDEANIPVVAAWLMDNPQRAEQAIAQQKLDLVMIGRSFLINPHWAYEAAQALQIENPSRILPPSYAHWLSRYRK